MPFVTQRLAELSGDLYGEVDRHDAVLSGDHGLQKRKLLPKPKARMDAYRVNCSVFSFAVSSINAPLKAHKLKEAESLSVPVATMQTFEQDACILTMVRSFLDCSSMISTRLLDESLLLPSALATEAYQLTFDPTGSSVFGDSLPAL